MFLQECARFRTQPWKYFFLLEYSYHRNQLLSVRFRTLHCHISQIDFHRNILVNLFFILSKLKWRKYALVHMISGLFSISLNLRILQFTGFLKSVLCLPLATQMVWREFLFENLHLLPNYINYCLNCHKQKSVLHHLKYQRSWFL